MAIPALSSGARSPAGARLTYEFSDLRKNSARVTSMISAHIRFLIRRALVTHRTRQWI